MSTDGILARVLPLNALVEERFYDKDTHRGRQLPKLDRKIGLGVNHTRMTISLTKKLCSIWVSPWLRCNCQEHTPIVVSENSPKNRI